MVSFPVICVVSFGAAFVELFAAPLLPVVLAVVLVVVLPLIASLALLAGDGDVRTSVAVSLRGTAF